MFETILDMGEAVADWVWYRVTWRKRRAYVAMVFRRLGVEE